eukprot:TRINITY_DN40739_c0_g1_i1.p1 TRINITY_DN40739_c0_g1~~TRINITY_DN40739_c0_g1_i1.p1  ORF type:complete len:462 (+),score=84.91 TRINITY_DN40739_c0_g1_i1:80-1465(+)
MGGRRSSAASAGWFLLLLLRECAQVRGDNETLSSCWDMSLEQEGETQLRKRLLQGYRAGAMPRSNGKAVEVDLGMNVIKLAKMSQLTGTFSMNVWLRMRWQDDRLTWPVRLDETGKCISDKPSDLPCMMTFDTYREFPDVIWTPDITLWNPAESPLNELQMTQALVYPDGDVRWSRPGSILATCKYELEQFPSDLQDCHLDFASWSYDTGSLKLSIDKLFSPPVYFDPYSFVENEEWNIDVDRFVLTEKTFQCCRYPFEVFRVYFKAMRKDDYYTGVFVMPAVILTLATGLSVGIPFDSGERISYVTAMIVTLVLFLMTVAEQLPKTAQKVTVQTVFDALLYGSIAFLALTVLYIKWRDNQHSKELKEHREKQTRLLRGASQMDSSENLGSRPSTGSLGSEFTDQPEARKQSRISMMSLADVSATLNQAKGQLGEMKQAMRSRSNLFETTPQKVVHITFKT